MPGDIPHPWDLTPKEAIALQKRLAPQVDTHTPLDLDAVRLVAGVDVSVRHDVSRAAIVVLTFPALEVVEAATARLPTPFPYVSGLLSLREGPVVLAARRNLSHQPDVYIFDGQGIAHFRRIGIASHIGLWWDAPTVGCAKSRLVGTHAELGPEKGAFQPLWHNSEQVGVILRTCTHVKPVYISVGHRTTLDSARELVLRCTTRYRLPEPIRAAHHTAGAFS
jgi:deoxyribonuclease V